MPGATRDEIDAIFHLYDPPVWLITTRAGTLAGGLIATSVSRVSIVPDQPRVLLTIAKQHFTWGLIESSERFVLHLLAADDLDTVWRFGLASGREVEKLAGLAVSETPAGAPRYDGALAWLDCRVEARLDIGDRTAYLAAVSDGARLRQAPTLTVATLLQQASPEHREALRRLHRRDQAIDRAAIHAWRGTRDGGD